MAPIKPYKSRILSGSMQMAEHSAGVRAAATHSAAVDSNRFASGIMGKHGFTRGNYLGRLSLVFKLQRELVQHVMRGAEGGDVMTNQWFIRLQQMQQAMPATPQVQKVIAETTRLLERVIVVQEAAQPNKAQVPGLPDHSSATKPDVRNSGERADTANSGRNDRAGKEKTDRTARTGESSSATNEGTRKSRKSAQSDKPDKDGEPDQPKKRGRGSKRQKKNDMTADTPAIETELPEKRNKPAGKAVIRMKSSIDGLVFLNDENDGSGRNRNSLSDIRTKPAMMPIADRFTTNGNMHYKQEQNRFERQAHRLSRNLFLQPIDMILRSTRNRTYVESIADKYARTFQSVNRNPTVRHEPARLHRSIRHDRFADQAKRLNVEHNEGYSAEIARPDGRSIVNPAMESHSPSRMAESIRLSYKLPAPAPIGTLPGGFASNRTIKSTISGWTSTAADNRSGHSPRPVVRRRMPSPFEPLISRYMDGYLWSDSAAGKLLPARMPMVPRRQASDHAGRLTERTTTPRYALRHISASDRSLNFLTRAVRPDDRSASSKWNDRLNGQAEPTGRLPSRDRNDIATYAARSVPISDNTDAMPATSRAAAVRPGAFELPRRSNPVSHTIMRRSVHQDRGTHTEFAVQLPLPKVALSNPVASDALALRVMRKSLGAAFRSITLPFVLRLDRPAKRVVYTAGGNLIDDTARKHRLDIDIRRTGRTTPYSEKQSVPDIAVRSDRLSIKEEYNKPLRTVHRSLSIGGLKAPSAPMRDSIGKRTPLAIPVTIPSETGRPNAARPDHGLSSSTPGTHRNPAAEPVNKTDNPAALSLEREMSALLKQISARQEPGIQRYPLDQTERAENDAKRIFPLIGEWNTNRESDGFHKPGGRWFRIDRQRMDRFNNASPELGDRVSYRSTSRLAPINEDGQPLIVSGQPGNMAAIMRSSSARSMQQAIRSRVRIENGDAGLVPPVLRLFMRSGPRMADLPQKHISRHPPPAPGVDRSNVTPQIKIHRSGIRPMPAAARPFQRSTAVNAATEPVPSSLRLVRQRDADNRGAIRAETRSRPSTVPGSGIMKPVTIRRQAEPFASGYMATRAESAMNYRRPAARDDTDRPVASAVQLRYRSGKIPAELRLEEITRIQDDFRKLREGIRDESDGGTAKPAVIPISAMGPMRRLPIADGSPHAASARSTIGGGRAAAQTGNISNTRNNRFGFPPGLSGLDTVAGYPGYPPEKVSRRSIVSTADPTFGPVKNRVHRRRNEGAAGGIGASSAFDTVRSGASDRMLRNGSAELSMIRAVRAGQIVPRSEIIRKRHERTESVSSIRGSEEVPPQSGIAMFINDRIRNGFPILEQVSGQRRSGSRSTASNEGAHWREINRSHLQRSSWTTDPGAPASDSSQSLTGMIRTKTSAPSGIVRRIHVSVPMPIAVKQASQSKERINESRIDRDYRRHSSASRFNPIMPSNRSYGYSDDRGGTAAERLNPLQRSSGQRANPSGIHRSSDGPYTDISVLPNRYPGRERYDIGSNIRSGAGTNLTVYRKLNQITSLTENIRAAGPFEPGYSRDRAAGVKNGTVSERIYTIQRKEAPNYTSALPARTGGAASEKTAFPYRTSGHDRMERDNLMLSRMNSSASHVQAVHYKNHSTIHTNILRPSLSAAVLPTLGLAVGESGRGSTYVQRAASPIGGTSAAGTILHTVRDSIGIIYGLTNNKSGERSKETSGSHRPDRTRTAVTELRLMRMATAAGTQVPGTNRAGMTGRDGPAALDRRKISPQAPIVLSAAPTQVLRLKESDVQPIAAMLPMEHKMKAPVPGALGADPADIDYRRQAKPAAPAETVSAIEPAPPQLDMAELQEMVMGLPQFDIKNITDRVYREIERKIRFDRQTRGL